MENNNEKFEATEFDRFLEKYEVERIRDNFKERVLTIVIASLGLIAALAWDEALRHLFEIIFGASGTLAEQLSYAVIITVIAAVISVYLGKIYSKREEK